MFQDITLEELLELKKNKELTMIDVRSPQEFKDATIPGSINIPIFDDAERAEIGTMYKQVSVQAAKERGLEIVSAKLPAFVKSFAELPGRRAVFCWRGGMRSKTTATVLDLMGIHTYRLTGGYRAYRQWVVERLAQMELQSRFCVITGNTGAGKTAILRRLQEEGYPVLDLERLAGHRGSIFGQVGLSANNQKTFEASLITQLMQLENAPYLLMEGESKRIGKVVVPGFVLDKKEAGIQLFIDMPLAERARHIVEEYRPSEHKEQLLSAYQHIKDRIHTPIAKEIELAMQAEQFEHAVRLLLEHYYDPRYEHAMLKYAEGRIVLKAQSVEHATALVKEQLSTLALA